MINSNLLALHVERKSAANMARELVALDQMSVGELAEKYRAMFGEPTRSRTKEYLRKRIAWHLQEHTEGGLSHRALERIEQLAPNAPARWRRPVAGKDGTLPAPPITLPSRDPRLPPVGDVITRTHNGVEHKVTVLASGFEYSGKCYRSLSKIARLITGKSWNGFLFFFGRAHLAQGGAEGHLG